jgi:hypothetical protein
MYVDGYIAEHIFEILGLLVTSLGIWFVVQQLRQAKISAQAETLLRLSEWSAELEDETFFLTELVETEKWKKLSQSESYDFMMGEKSYFKTFFKISSLYEMVGVLVRTKALDESLAYEMFDYFLPLMYRNYEKFTLAYREFNNVQTVNVHWEWVAKEFEKKTARRNS